MANLIFCPMKPIQHNIRLFLAPLVIGLLSAFHAVAQQDVQFTHNMFNGLIYNPAVAGSKDGMSAFLLTRNQWVGFEGAPTTQTVSIDAPIAKLRGGIGLHIVNDRLGYESQIGANASYAYKLPLNDNAVLSLGLSIGFAQKTIDGANFNPITKGDLHIPVAKISDIIAPDLGFGLFYKSAKMYLALSSSHLTEPLIASKTNSGLETGLKVVRHYFATAGYNYALTPALDIRPSFFLKFTEASIAKPIFDINGLLFYKQRVWIGTSYRSIDAVALLLGFNINEQLRVGYSYDINTSKLANFNSGSHEFVIGYDWKVNTSKRSTIIMKSPRFL